MTSFPVLALTVLWKYHGCNLTGTWIPGTRAPVKGSFIATVSTSPQWKALNVAKSVHSSLYHHVSGMRLILPKKAHLSLHLQGAERPRLVSEMSWKKKALFERV